MGRKCCCGQVHEDLSNCHNDVIIMVLAEVRGDDLYGRRNWNNIIDFYKRYRPQQNIIGGIIVKGRYPDDPNPSPDGMGQFTLPYDTQGQWSYLLVPGQLGPQADEELAYIFSTPTLIEPGVVTDFFYSLLGRIPNRDPLVPYQGLAHFYINAMSQEDYVHNEIWNIQLENPDMIAHASSLSPPSASDSGNNHIMGPYTSFSSINGVWGQVTLPFKTDYSFNNNSGCDWTDRNCRRLSGPCHATPNCESLNPYLSGNYPETSASLCQDPPLFQTIEVTLKQITPTIDTTHNPEPDFDGILNCNLGLGATYILNVERCSYNLLVVSGGFWSKWVRAYGDPLNPEIDNSRLPPWVITNGFADPPSPLNDRDFDIYPPSPTPPYADRFLSTTNNNTINKFIYQDAELFIPGWHTFSVWAKATSGDNQRFRIWIEGIPQEIVATAEWAQYSVSAMITGSSARVMVTNTDPASEVDILLWGPQLEHGASATAYIYPWSRHAYDHNRLLICDNPNIDDTLWLSWKPVRLNSYGPDNTFNLEQAPVRVSGIISLERSLPYLSGYRQYAWMSLSCLNTYEAKMIFYAWYTLGEGYAHVHMESKLTLPNVI